MLSPTPDVSEQRRIIEDLFQRSKNTPNTEGYLIPAKWFQHWKEHVGYDGSSPTFFKVNPIDNKSLLSDNQPRADLKLHEDYEVVPETVYNTLQEWYGGGPSLKRNVEHDPVHDCDDAIITVPSFDIYYNDSHHTFEYSRFQPIKNLKQIACEFFSVTNAQLRTRLCDYFMKICQTELSDDKCLEYYSIPSGSTLILQVQNEDGTWPQPAEANAFWTRIDKSDPGMHGFQEVDNGCYINVVLQCLSHSQPFINYFSGDDWKSSINELNPRGTKGRLASAFAIIVRDMWNSKISVMSPRFFKDTIFNLGRRFPPFKKDEQGDVHELITFTLDLIGEDLNRSTEKALGPPVEGTLSNEAETAQASWERHTKYQNSFIVDNFHGLFRSRVECRKCNHTTVVFEPYSTISLALPLPLQNTAPFTFIPWDLKKPRIKMVLKLNNPTLLTEAIDAICAKMNRKMDIIFAEHRQNSIELNWLDSLETTSTDNKLVAFELPNHLPDAVFAQVRLMAPVLNANRKTPKELDPFCLVQLSSSVLDGKSDAIQEECQKRFEPLFSPSTGEITNSKVKDIFKNLYRPQPNEEEFTTRLKAKVYSHAYEKQVKFERDSVYPIVTKRRIDVSFNPSIICDPSKFNWTALQNVQNAIEVQKDYTVSNIFSLKECLDLFVSEDELDEKNLHFCPYCQEKTRCVKKMDIWSAPKVLIVHLKRYQCNMYVKTNKLIERVTYPDTLDLSSYIVGPDQDKENKYRLYAIIEHAGTLEAGHYDTIIYQNQKDKWFKFIDQNVQIIKKEKAHSQDAYVLFYVRIDE